MKLWLDDERDPKGYPGWETAIWVTTPEEAISLLETQGVDALSLDNDLGLEADEHGNPREGYTVANWLEEKVMTDPTFLPPRLLNCHSANSVASTRMNAAFKTIRRAMSAR